MSALHFGHTRRRVFSIQLRMLKFLIATATVSKQTYRRLSFWMWAAVINDVQNVRVAGDRLTKQTITDVTDESKL